MTTDLPLQPSAVSAVVSAPIGRTALEQAAHAEAKKLKKERKAERLRSFLGWCEGCQAFGSGF